MLLHQEVQDNRVMNMETTRTFSFFFFSILMKKYKKNSTWEIIPYDVMVTLASESCQQEFTSLSS